MKRTISLALCLVLSSSILSSCSNSSEPFEEKNYTSDTQINEINLDIRDREIEVSASEDEQIHIQYFENNKEYYDISVSDENVLTMTSASDKEWTDYIGVKTSAEDRKISLQNTGRTFEQSYTIYNKRGYNIFCIGFSRKCKYFF